TGQAPPVRPRGHARTDARHVPHRVSGRRDEVHQRRTVNRGHGPAGPGPQRAGHPARQAGAGTRRAAGAARRSAACRSSGAARGDQRRRGPVRAGCPGGHAGAARRRGRGGNRGGTDGGGEAGRSVCPHPGRIGRRLAGHWRELTETERAPNLGARSPAVTVASGRHAQTGDIKMPQETARAHTQGNTPRAASITPTRSWMPNGWTGSGGAPSLPAVLDYAARCMAQHTSIVFAGVAAPERAERVPGWKAWHAGPWTVYRGQDTTAGHLVAVGYRDGFDQRQYGTLFDATTSGQDIADRLHRFGKAIGFTWCGTAASTAMFALRASWENVSEKPLWHLRAPVPKVSSGALIWDRQATVKEAGVPAWAWDVNGAHLTAAGMAEVAWSSLEHTGPRMFDKRAPGYWLVTVPDQDPYAPPVVDAEDLDEHGRAWVTTPVCEWLQ